MSAIFKVPERAPELSGVNVTLTVQVLIGAIAEVQLFVAAKSEIFEPVMLVPATTKGAVPVFVTVTGCDALVVFVT